MIAFLEESVHSIEIRKEAARLFGRYLQFLRNSGARDADNHMSVLFQTTLSEANSIRLEFVRKENERDYTGHEELAQRLTLVRENIELLATIGSLDVSHSSPPPTPQTDRMDVE